MSHKQELFDLVDELVKYKKEVDEMVDKAIEENQSRARELEVESTPTT